MAASLGISDSDTIFTIIVTNLLRLMYIQSKLIYNVDIETNENTYILQQLFAISNFHQQV